MGLAPKDIVYAVQLAFFAAAVLPMNFIMFKRGAAFFYSWFFLALFCVVRVAATALLLNADLTHTTSEAGTILYSVAVAPLMFAILGISVEASVSVHHRHPRLFGHLSVVVLHGAVIAAIVILIVGFVNIIGDLENGEQPTNTDVQLLQAGASLLLVIVIGIAAVVLFSYSMYRSSRLEKILITAVVLCLPFLFLRILYSFLGVVINNASWNFLQGGTIAELVCLDVLPEFAIILILLAAGWWTRELRHEGRTKQVQQTPQTYYANQAAA